MAEKKFSFDFTQEEFERLKQLIYCGDRVLAPFEAMSRDRDHESVVEKIFRAARENGDDPATFEDRFHENLDKYGDSEMFARLSFQLTLLSVRREYGAEGWNAI